MFFKEQKIAVVALWFLFFFCYFTIGVRNISYGENAICPHEDWTECADERTKRNWIEYAPDWKLLKRKGDVLVYRRQLPSGIIQCKAEKIIYARPEVIEQLVRDVPAYAEFMHNCKHAQTIKEFTDEDLVIHNVTALPWPLQPRDGVVRTRVTKDWKYGRFEVLCYGLHSPESEKWVPPVKGYTRMYEISVYMIMHILGREKGKCYYIIHADPTGVPLFAVNLLMDEYPYRTLLNFEKMLQREKYISLGKKSKYLPQIEAFCKLKQHASQK
ncbi:MAG: START domain-containing protein [Spirochaetes bacterium]|nr:START domain-containing protein [Spirochaetota bacterium]